MLVRHHRLLTLRNLSRVVTGTAVASWRGHARISSLILIEVHGLNRCLRHVLRYNVASAETRRHGDALTDTVSINCAQHLRTGLVIDVSLGGELSQPQANLTIFRLFKLNILCDEGVDQIFVSSALLDELLVQH